MSRYIIDTDKHMSPFDGIVMTTLGGLENADRALEDAYQRGFEDGKAVNDKGCEECKYGGSPQGSSPCYNCSNYYRNNWTAKDDKIEVGDEVIFNSTMKCLVVKPESDESYASLIDSNGNHHSAENCDFKKAGRHFDIQSILEEMRK